jgi:hypothetical protein
MCLVMPSSTHLTGTASTLSLGLPLVESVVRGGGDGIAATRKSLGFC